MSVELFIRRRHATEPEYYSMTGASGWEAIWLPAAAELGLDLIPRLGDGSFARVPEDALATVMSQLTSLRDWMSAHGQVLYADHLNAILPALASLSPGDEVSFG